MASILNADDGVVSGSAGLKSNADSSGVLDLQTNGVTAVTVNTNQSVSLTAGTANGVTYLNGSKVLTSGSALTFNGTNLATGRLLSGRYTSDVNGWGIQNYSAASAFASGIQLVYGGVGAAAMWVPAASALAFGADGGAGTTELMRLTSTGLGIGTSSPSSKLSVNGGSTQTVANFTSTSTAVFYALVNSGSQTFIGNDSTSGSFVVQTPASSYSTKFSVSNAGVVSDLNGNLRAVPQSGSSKTSSYTLATTDVGEYILLGASGAIVIPDATFAAGDIVTIFNNTASTATITCSITTAYIAGTFTDKATMTLAAAGVATVLFITSTLCVVSGNVT
jgi:hypothetical protein